MFCQMCGKENSDQNTFCLYCGYNIAENKTERSKEIYIIITNFLKNKKLVMIILGIVLIILILALTSLKLDKNGYFRNTKWGMTLEQVKASESNGRSDFSNYNYEKKSFSMKLTVCPFSKVIMRESHFHLIQKAS